MCEQNRSYTPGKSFVQILLLPVPFRAFISSPQILTGQAAPRSKTENVEEIPVLNGAENTCCQSLLDSGAKIRTVHLVWSDIIHVSLTLRSTSKERLFGLLCACETWFAKGKRKLGDDILQRPEGPRIAPLELPWAVLAGVRNPLHWQKTRWQKGLGLGGVCRIGPPQAWRTAGHRALKCPRHGQGLSGCTHTSSWMRSGHHWSPSEVLHHLLTSFSSPFFYPRRSRFRSELLPGLWKYSEKCLKSFVCAIWLYCSLKPMEQTWITVCS